MLLAPPARGSRTSSEIWSRPGNEPRQVTVVSRRPKTPRSRANHEPRAPSYRAIPSPREKTIDGAGLSRKSPTFSAPERSEKNRHPYSTCRSAFPTPEDRRRSSAGRLSKRPNQTHFGPSRTGAGPGSFLLPVKCKNTGGLRSAVCSAGRRPPRNSVLIVPWGAIPGSPTRWGPASRRIPVR